MNKFLIAAALAALAFLAPVATTVASTGYDEFDRWIWIQNNSGREIEYVYSANYDEYFNSGFDGIDLLDEEQTIAPGEGTWVSVEDYTGYCQYWIRVKFEDGDTATSRNEMNACHRDYVNSPTLNVR